MLFATSLRSPPVSSASDRSESNALVLSSSSLSKPLRVLWALLSWICQFFVRASFSRTTGPSSQALSAASPPWNAALQSHGPTPSSSPSKTPPSARSSQKKKQPVSSPNPKPHLTVNVGNSPLKLPLALLTNLQTKRGISHGVGTFSRTEFRGRTLVGPE